MELVVKEKQHVLYVLLSGPKLQVKNLHSKKLQIGRYDICISDVHPHLGAGQHEETLCPRAVSGSNSTVYCITPECLLHCSHSAFHLGTTRSKTSQHVSFCNDCKFKQLDKVLERVKLCMIFQSPKSQVKEQNITSEAHIL